MNSITMKLTDMVRPEKMSASIQSNSSENLSEA